MDDSIIYIKEKQMQIDSWISELAVIRTQLEQSDSEVNALSIQVSSLSQQLDDLKNIFSDAHSFNEAGMGRLRDITEKSWNSIEENVKKSLSVFERSCSRNPAE